MIAPRAGDGQPARKRVAQDQAARNRAADMLKNYIGLPRGVYILCAGSFINRAGSFFITFLMIYLVKRLGYSEVAATRAMGVFGLGAMMAALIGGHLADLIGRKTVMLMGLVGSAGMMVAFSFVRTYPVIVGALLFLALLADMYRPAASAMIADLVEPARRPHAYGLMYVSINLGFAVAPVVGGFLVAYSFKLLFWLDAVTSLAYALIILMTIRETLPARRGPSPANGADGADGADGGEKVREESVVEVSVRAGEAARIILGDRVFLAFCFATLLVAMVYQQATSTLPLYLQNIGIDAQHYGRIIAVNGILIVCFQIPITSLIHRRDRFRVLGLSAFIVALGFGYYAIARTPMAFTIGVVIWTIGEMLQSPVVPSVVTDLAPVRVRARYFGLLSMCFSGGNMIAAPIGGEILAHLGGRRLWILCLFVSLAAALIYASLRRAALERTRPAAAG